jgi:hypothetical protein
MTQLTPCDLQEADAKLALVRQRAEAEKQRAEVDRRDAAALLVRSDAEKRRMQEKYQKARTTLREITAEFQNVRAADRPGTLDLGSRPGHR